MSDTIMSNLKDFIVPLKHDTLTKDQVAERCINAAKTKGYKTDPDFTYEEAKTWTKPPALYFYASSNSIFGFYITMGQYEHPNTLEVFEEYCGEKQSLPDNSIEQRIASLEGKIDHLADILAEKLQEPKEGAKVDDRVRIDGLFAFSEKITILCLLDNSMLWLPPDESTWCKAGNHGETDVATLITVKKHTAGKFYLLKQGEPNDFDDYALCLSAVNFVVAQDIAGVVTISTISRDHVSMQEVQPLNQ